MIQGAMTEPKRYASGDECPLEGCGGVLSVYASRNAGSVQVQYLACNTCGLPPAGNNKILKMASEIRRRRKRCI